MENLKLFNELNSEIKKANEEIELLKQDVDNKREQLREMLKNMLTETNPVFEEFIIKWAMENPIETISYYMATKSNSGEVFFENESGYVRVFGHENCNKDTYYALINKKTLDIKKIQINEIEDFYLSPNCDKGIFMELEFLDNYKIPLIKDCCKYINNCAFTTEYKALKYELYSKAIFSIIEKNFMVDEFVRYTSKEEI